MTLAGALVSCTFLGLQHGIDVDHVAAITDVTSIQRTPLDATRCGLLYAVGHAATVGLLGIGVITLKHSVPPQASMWMERVIGMAPLPTFEPWRKQPTGICGWERHPVCFVSMVSGSRALSRAAGKFSPVRGSSLCLRLVTEASGLCSGPAN
jgi:hypothetical protein